MARHPERSRFSGEAKDLTSQKASVSSVSSVIDYLVSFVNLRVLRGERRNYFLNRFSNAARASFGRRLAGVEVSFSRVTRIS